ncbi:MAG: hypothetical protein JO157_18110 [Acetobacteraceae bacterium]|nr:hypothetical protein [Acetobacteraceae bacterium]
MRLLVSAFALALAAAPAMAANANHPYSNIDRRVDAGNDTGDSRVDALNRSQLDENYYANRPQQPPPGYGMPAPMPPGYAR